MILFDGKKLAEKILSEMKVSRKLRLAVVVVGEDPVVQKFIEQKKRVAASVGIDTRVYPFPAGITTNELRRELRVIVHEPHNHGVVIQLPMPPHINTRYILDSVVPGKDIDVLSSSSIGDVAVGKGRVIPPVVGAIQAFFKDYRIEYQEKYIVIAGAGNLVGKPAAIWLLNEGVTFSIVRSSTPHPEDFLRKADILITGIGKPKYITGDMVKDGVIVIDAGTSESEGKVMGDVDFDSVSLRSSFITPVPGGIGPVAVAMLFRNLILLSQKK